MLLLAQGHHKVIIKPGRKVSNGKRKTTLTYSETTALADHFLSETREASEDSGMTRLKGKEANPESYIQQNYPSKMKTKEDRFQVQKV